MGFIEGADRIAKKVERFLPGSSASRSAGQKIRLGILVALPVAALGTGLFLALNGHFDPQPDMSAVAAAASKMPEPTGEISAKVLPNVDHDFVPPTDFSHDVEIVEAGIGQNDHILTGRVRNHSNHLVRAADLVFDLTDVQGSQLGGISVRVENIAANSTASFRLQLDDHAARTALVREIHSR